MGVVPAETIVPERKVEVAVSPLGHRGLAGVGTRPLPGMVSPMGNAFVNPTLLAYGPWLRLARPRVPRSFHENQRTTQRQIGGPMARPPSHGHLFTIFQSLTCRIKALRRAQWCATWIMVFLVGLRQTVVPQAPLDKAQPLDLSSGQLRGRGSRVALCAWANRQDPSTVNTGTSKGAAPLNRLVERKDIGVHRPAVKTGHTAPHDGN